MNNLEAVNSIVCLENLWLDLCSKVREWNWRSL